MALEICPVAYTAESYDRAVIVDTVRERPLPLPLFDDANAADAFLDVGADPGGLGPTPPAGRTVETPSGTTRFGANWGEADAPPPDDDLGGRL